MKKILNISDVDSDKFQRLCQAYIDKVSHWNSLINIVSTRDVDKLLTDLIRQSVAPLAHLTVPEGAKLMDIGSGAGIPAFPLKFARPDLQLTLLEPRRKKSLFLKRVAGELGLSGVEVECSRIEAVRDRPAWREAFDLVTVRGTGPAPRLLPMVEPLLRPGGAFWAFKGRAGKRELKEVQTLSRRHSRLIELEETLSLLVVDF